MSLWLADHVWDGHRVANPCRFFCSVADADAHSKGSWNYQVWGIKHCKYMMVLSDFLRKKYCIVWGWSYNEPCTSNVLRLPLGYTHVRQIAPPWAMHENVKCLVSTFFLCHKWAEASNPQSFQKIQPFWFGFQENWFRHSIVFQICFKGRFFSKRSFFLMNSHGTIGTFTLLILTIEINWKMLVHHSHHPMDPQMPAPRQRTPRPVVVSLQEIRNFCWCFMNILGVSSMNPYELIWIPYEFLYESHMNF